MKPNKKQLIFIALSFITIGAILMAIAFSLGARTGVYWENGRFRVSERRVQNHVESKTITKSFEDFERIKNIEIKGLDFYTIDFNESDRFEIEATYYYEDELPLFEVEDGKLTIETQAEERFQITNFDFDVLSDDERPYLYISYPAGMTLDDIEISSDYATIFLNMLNGKSLTLDGNYLEGNGIGCEFEKVEIKSDFSHYDWRESFFKKLELKMDYTEMTMADSQLNTLTSKTDYGALLFENCTVTGETEFDFNYTTIDFYGDLMDKNKFKGDFGNISLKLNELDTYDYKIDIEMGDILIDDVGFSEKIEKMTHASKVLDIKGSFTEVILEEN